MKVNLSLSTSTAARKTVKAGIRLAGYRASDVTYSDILVKGVKLPTDMSFQALVFRGDVNDAWNLSLRIAVKEKIGNEVRNSTKYVEVLDLKEGFTEKQVAAAIKKGLVEAKPYTTMPLKAFRRKQEGSGLKRGRAENTRPEY